MATGVRQGPSRFAGIVARVTHDPFRMCRAFQYTVCSAVFAASTVGAAAAGETAVRPVEGPVLLARAGTDAQYLWNASLYVTHLLADKQGGSDGIHALEATAISALADKSRASQATTVRIKVVYAKTGDVSPVYGTATFTGMEDVLTLSAARSDLAKHAAEWTQQLAAGHVPAHLKVDMTGTLPPVR